MLRNKKAVIFDLDGTLVDSMWMWEEIDIEFLGERNLELPKTLQTEIEGMSFTETATYFKKTFQLSESIEELKTIWNGMAYEKYKTQVPFKKGAEEFLLYLKELGIKTGIATSNSRELVNVVSSAHNLEYKIDYILTSCEVNIGKPAPDIYLTTAKNLGVRPEECLVIEDVPMGILAGKNANMEVCGIYDPYSLNQEEEKRKLADYYIQSFEDILNGTYEVLKHE